VPRSRTRLEARVGYCARWSPLPGEPARCRRGPRAAGLRTYRSPMEPSPTIRKRNALRLPERGHQHVADCRPVEHPQAEPGTSSERRDCPRTAVAIRRSQRGTRQGERGEPLPRGSAQVAVPHPLGLKPAWAIARQRPGDRSDYRLPRLAEHVPIVAAKASHDPVSDSSRAGPPLTPS